MVAVADSRRKRYRAPATAMAMGWFVSSRPTKHKVTHYPVEIKQFRGQANRTLVPRVLGRTAARVTSGRRSILTPEEFLQQFSNVAERDAASQLIDAAVAAGALLAWGPSGV